jgi:predicted Zn-dependent peptidase
MDAVGGEMNAFTGKEYTCFYARVLDTDLPLAVDVICDMVASSVIASADVESERGVILEEIAMHDDDPGDVVHDAFASVVYGDAPLGRPVLGTVESITEMSRTQVAGYYRRRYSPTNLVVAAAGNLDHRTLVRHVRRAFGEAGLLDGSAQAAPVPPRDGGARPRTLTGVHVVNRPTEQAHLVLGCTGLFGIYAGTTPGKVDDVLDICREQLQRVAEGGITTDELARGKGQLRGSLVLGLEDTGSRMSRLGKSELVYGQLLSVDDLLARIEDVTVDDIREVAADVLSRPLSLAVIGPFDDKDFAGAVG